MLEAIVSSCPTLLRFLARPQSLPLSHLLPLVVVVVVVIFIVLVALSVKRRLRLIEID